MPTTYALNKKHIYNYRAKYPDKYREVNKKSELKRRNWRKIQMEFLNILLD